MHDILVLIASASSEIYMDRCMTFSYLLRHRAAKSTWIVHYILVLNASVSSKIYMDRCTTFWYLSRQWAAKSTWTGARHFRTYRVSKQRNLHWQVHKISILIASVSSEIYMDRCTRFRYLSRQWAAKSTWTGAQDFDTYRVSKQRNLHGQVQDILVLIVSVSSGGSDESAYTQTHQSLRCSHMCTQNIDLDESWDQS